MRSPLAAACNKCNQLASDDTNFEMRPISYEAKVARSSRAGRTLVLIPYSHFAMAVRFIPPHLPPYSCEALGVRAAFVANYRHEELG